MPTELTGTYRWTRHRWPNHGAGPQDRQPDTIIGNLHDGTVVKGLAFDGELVTGTEYRFYGKQVEHERWGKQFHFTGFRSLEPNSRNGVIAYLKNHCKGIGPGIGARLYDTLGPDAVRLLRQDPKMAAVKVQGLTVEVAGAAAKVLNEHTASEDAKIELMGLFDGRGFGRRTIDKVLELWGPGAAERIKKNPWVLLYERVPGAGFLRVDRLYLDLGLPADAMKRQIICAWWGIYSDTSGHTWLPLRLAQEGVRDKITAGDVKPSQAVEAAIEEEWLAVDEFDGEMLVADSRRAANEEVVAERVAEMLERGAA